MSALDRLAAQMRQMDEFAAECEPLPEPGSVVTPPQFRVSPIGDTAARLDPSLAARFNAIGAHLARRRAEIIETWFLESAQKLLTDSFDADVFLDSTPAQQVTILHAAGIGLTNATEIYRDVLPPGEELFIIEQHGIPVAGMRLRNCLGSDGSTPLPVELQPYE